MTWTRIPKWKTSKHLLTLATSIFSYIYSQCQFVILNIQLISTTLIFPFVQTHACRLSIVKTCTLESHHIRTFFTYLYNQNVNDLRLLNNLLWFIIFPTTATTSSHAPTWQILCSFVAHLALNSATQENQHGLNHFATMSGIGLQVPYAQGRGQQPQSQSVFGNAEMSTKLLYYFPITENEWDSMTFHI